MEYVCKEEDCPLYPDHEWRKNNLKELNETIEQLEHANLDIKTLKALHLAFTDKTETEEIPANCYICKYMTPIDMKRSFLVGVAKSKLLS